MATPKGPNHPSVRNATDREQVAAAARREQRRKEHQAAIYGAVLATEAGRAVLWDLLERAGVYGSVWRMTAEIHYLAGRQDFGHELMATLLEVSEDHYELMGREARARSKRDQAETDAVHIARAEQGDR